MQPRRAQISTMMEMLPPFAIRVAATLRLSDHIADGHGALADLATAAAADPDALRRLLRYLVTLGLYTEPAPDSYRVTAAGRMLAAGHPTGLHTWLDLDGPGGRMDLALGGLLHSVRTGEPGFDQVFGHSFWADLAAAPDRQATFDALMAGKSARVAADLASELSWSGRLVDVGGGCGATLRTILSGHPELRGTLLELPAPAERARAVFAEAGLAERCEVEAGSFLTAVPPGGDTYLLFDILHDWDDLTAEAILRRCADACVPGGRVLVVEELPNGVADRVGAAMDLKMLTMFAGRQRDAAALGELASRSGLRAVDICLLPSGFSVVTCVDHMDTRREPSLASPRLPAHGAPAGKDDPR